MTRPSAAAARSQWSGSSPSQGRSSTVATCVAVAAGGRRRGRARFPRRARAPGRASASLSPASPTQTATASSSSGTGEHLGGRARALRREHEAGEIGAGLGRDGDVLLRASARRPSRAAGASSSASFAAGSGACISAEPTRIASAPASSAAAPCARVWIAALGDDDRSAGQRGSATRSSCVAAVDRERREVARVDPDHRRPQPRGAGELVRVVRLDERVEPELVGDAA